jgi:hypothetical protein
MAVKRTLAVNLYRRILSELEAKLAVIERGQLGREHLAGMLSAVRRAQGDCPRQTRADRNRSNDLERAIESAVGVSS